ncbi:twin-arginine translocase subunit TatC [Cypionkella sp.]|jgi:sec-independent protein translocase protein TatC|uniref:twin-arginine translocase subunit TatC n=1 Tax=Cypionkella sp. TaxID=2811411 RepID=UPI00271BEE15|nr:twin-arginine translocase subunit TatC [Cypionkella sp.]MDO8982124.1 twin-arginine translocase subunit TatC [Cypionkella sp.]MDP2048645.1 twin-arginine translocase subunit TatC [Cypionkella sp.]
MSHTDDVDASAAPLIEHLKELRNRILVSVAVLGVGCLIGYLLWIPIFHVLSIPMCNAMADYGQKCQFVLIKLQEGFFVAVKIAVWAGFAMSFPVIAFQLWRFVAPGLYRNEKGAFLPFLLASPAMFIAGAAFAYYMILPGAFHFFLSYQGDFSKAMNPGEVPVAPSITGAAAGVLYQGSVESFLSLTMQFIMAFGLCFQLPVLLTLMGKAGMISSSGLRATRKYAVVAILSVAAVATPPDVMSQLIMFFAIYPLYELSIWMIAGFEKKREAAARADGSWVDEDE